MEQDKHPPYSLWAIVKYFLYLGYAGFGGPVALVGYMHTDLVEKRRWFTDRGLWSGALGPGGAASASRVEAGIGTGNPLRTAWLLSRQQGQGIRPGRGSGARQG